MRKNFTAIALFILQAAISFTTTTATAQTDVGALSVLEPSNPICAGSQTVKAIIRNYGAVDITSATIGWEVNGVVQNDTTYSGLIPSGTNDTVTLGTFTFNSANTYIFRVYTSAPNGGADGNLLNDTLTSATFTVALNGTYTIGGTTPDFAEFSDALAALNTQGICGPVVFNMRAMVDTMQAVITPITGASGTNTITFQSENGDSTSVRLLYPSQPAFTPTNYLIRLDGADYITFSKITMTRPGIEPYARILDYTGTATYNTISHCQLIGAVNTVTNSLSAIVYSTTSSATNDSMNTFSGNLFLNGSLGIYMNGNSNSSLEASTVVTGNTFTNQYSKAVQISNQANAILGSNIITSTSTYSGYAAIHLTSSQRSQLVTNNKISGITGTGIYLEDCSGFNTVPGIVANNFVQCSDTSGISMINGDYQDIVFNSVHMTGSNSSSAALSIQGGGTGKVVKNNVLANSGTGYSYRVGSAATASIASSNHNNLFSNGTNLAEFDGNDHTTLAALITDSQSDTNSVSTDPGFLSTTDLHATASAMDNAGTPRGNVTLDIDGTVRSLTTPDIGADEYTGVSRDIGVTSILSPANNSCGSSTTEVKVIISNFGASTETSFDVVCDITGSVTTTLNGTYSGSLTSGTSDTLTFSTTLNTSAGGTYNLEAYTSLSLDSDHSNDTLIANNTILSIPAAPTATADSTCGTGTVTMTAVATDSVRWYSAAIGGSLLDTGNTFTTPVINSTTTYYVASHNVCSSDRIAVVATVLPIPSVNLGNDTAVAAGNSVVFNAGAGFSSYLWSSGATTQSVTASVTDCYFVTVSNAFGCENSDTVCLNVIQPTDVGVLSIASPLNNDCESATADLSVVVRNFGANAASGVILHVNLTGIVNATFTDTINVSIASGTSVTRTLGSISTTGGGNLIIQAYTEFGPDLDLTNDTLLVTDTIIAPPAPPTGLGGSRCGAGAIVISAVASNTVEWYDAATGGTLVFTGNAYSITNLTTTTTFYAQNGNFCNNQIRTAVVATINPLPVVNLGSDIAATTGQIVTLDAGAGFSSYAWSTGGTTQTIDVTTSDTIIVFVTDANSCSNSDTIVVQFSVGIDQVAGLDFLNVFPNPATDMVNIQLSTGSNTDLEVRIVDVNGRNIIFDKIKDVNGAFRTEYSLSNFNSGIYFIQVISNEGVSIHRLVIQ
ncbi:MAG: T9SS type A sorting domain-containing protein [Bacteroidia bacterium]|nr:T9SS type A sorting domain-containing protein [Bacteroidia bacterium]